MGERANTTAVPKIVVLCFCRVHITDDLVLKPIFEIDVDTDSVAERLSLVSAFRMTMNDAQYLLDPS